MNTDFLKNKIAQAPRLILVPDGSGSKGDEAMICGCLNLLQGQTALLLTPNHKHWSDVLIGKTHLFDEVTVSLEQLPALIQTPHRLIVIGADTLDGSCGFEAAYWRLKTIQTAAANCGKVVVFCSVRSDMDPRLIEEWKALPDEVTVFLRDPVSMENYTNQTGKTARHFSDLAFFSKPVDTHRAAAFRGRLEEAGAGKRLIGLDISETMFESFHTELTDENRRMFAWQIASTVTQGLSPKDTAIVLLTHDTRTWEAHWSDYQFACAARERLEDAEGFTCILQPPELTQAELLTVIPRLELIVCGRMHMSVTSALSGVVPVVVAGTGKCYVMVDKVRGMCMEWFGSADNLALTPEQIPQIRDSILSGSLLKDALIQKLASLAVSLPEEQTVLENIFPISPVVWDDAAIREAALLRAMQRSAQLSQDNADMQALCSNKEAHIQLLLQSERELQAATQTLDTDCRQLRDDLRALEQQYLQTGARLEATEQALQQLQLDLSRREAEFTARETELQMALADRDNSIRQLQYDFGCREGECQQLRDKENRYLNELAALRSSRAYRLGNFFARIARFFVPKGSRRALFLKMTFNAFRHPRTFFRKLSPRNFKKFFRLLRKGNVAELQERMQASIHGQIYPEPLDIAKPEIAAVEELKKEDYALLQVPQWNDPQVSIIIPVYNQFGFTYRCIESIIKNSGSITYEIIVANDCSTDLTTELGDIIAGVTCITNEKNLRFLRNCNNAAKYAKGKYVLFLNNDTQVMADWLEPLVTLIESAEDIGMVGSKLLYPDGTLQEAGGILWRDGSAWNFGNRQNPQLPQFNYVKEADYISGAAIMLSRALWERIGGFDETFAPAYCEDSDLAFTVRKLGYRVMFQPRSEVVHFEGISNGTDTSSGQKQYQVENSVKFRKKWAAELASHPENGENVFQARDRSYRKKTLLMVDHYVPHFDKDAGSRTVFQYLKLFVSLGFNVKFIGDNFYRHEPYTTVLQQMGIEVLYGPEAAQNWESWIRENGSQFDYAFLNRPHIAPRYLEALRKYTKAKIMYYGHDLAFLRGMREYEVTGKEEFLQESLEWKPRELELMRASDMAYYPSYVEVDEIHKIDPDIQVKAIPAYLFEDVQWEGYDFKDRQDIMFIGGFGHRPNVDAVKWIANEILPELLKLLPDIKIHILGSNAPQEVLELAGPHLIMEGFVTDEQLEWFYRHCRLSFVPLRYGAGIKGKVVEAMRYGTPVVTTPTGAEGIPNAEQAFAVRESAQELAECIARIYNDPDTLTQMSRSCISYIRENYSPRNAIDIIGPEFGLIRKEIRP